MAHFKRGNLQLKTNQQIQLGDSQESLIKYDGSDLLVNPSSGALKLYNNGSEVAQTIATGLQAGVAAFDIKTSGGEDGITINNNGAVEVFYNNVKQFETISTGIQTGVAAFDIKTSGGNDGIRIYDGSNVLLYFNGNPVVSTSSTGLQAAVAAFDIETSGGEDGITINNNGSVEIFHNNIKSFETNVAGINVSDNSGNDPTIYFNNSSDATVGQIMCNNGAFSLYDDVNNKYFLTTLVNQGVSLYFNGVRTLETQTEEIRLWNSAGSAWFEQRISGSDVFLQNRSLGGAIQIWARDGGSVNRGMITMSPNNSVELFYQGVRQVKTIATGIQASDTITAFDIKTSGGEDGITINNNGSVELFYDNSLKLSTDATGVTVFGNLTTNDLTVDGNTIYLGGTTLTEAAGGGLEVDGIVSADAPTSSSHLVTLDYMSRLGTDRTRITYDGTSDLDISVEHITDVKYTDFQTGIQAPPWKEGRVFWDDDNHTFGVFNDVSNVILQVGQETHIRVKNDTGSPIDDGDIVYISGAQGQQPLISLAIATEHDKICNVGMATHNIGDGEFGYVTVRGLVRGIDTDSWSAGDRLYVSATVPGEIQNTAPEPPNQKAFVGTVIVKGSNGSILVNPAHHGGTVQLSDVYVGSRPDNSLLVWDSTASYYTNSHTITTDGTLSGNSDLNIPTEQAVKTYVDAQSVDVTERFTAMNEPTGYPNTTDSVMTFGVDGTNVFTIEPAATSFDVWMDGEKYTYTTKQSVTISETEGEHYIYFDQADQQLKETTVFPADLLYQQGFTAIVYWDSDNSEHIYFGEERHGITMDGKTHVNIHFGRGTLYRSGLALGDIVADGSGDSNASAQFSSTSGEITDEDIDITIAAQSAPANVPIFYKSGANGYWRKIGATDYPVTTTGTGRMAYNEFTGGAWQISEVSNNDFALTHIAASNDPDQPIIAIMGQAEYGNISSARLGATAEINNLVLSGLPFAEFVFMGTIIFQTSDSYANAVQSRIRSTDEGADYVDWRAFTRSSTGSTNDHGNLSGLGDDDHTQYILVDGSRDFTGTIGGIDPVADTDFVTKGYVDGTTLVDVNAYTDTQIATRAPAWTYTTITATTSGTSVTLTSAIPSDALEIEVLFNGVSTNTASQPPIVRLGDAGGVETTGYTGVVRGPTGSSAVTDGLYPFRTNAWAAADLLDGRMRLTRWDSSLHTWLADGLSNDQASLSVFTGKKTTSEVLTTIVLTTPGGTATFDAGSARVRYR
jgi:hypothetical protein